MTPAYWVEIAPDEYFRLKDQYINPTTIEGHPERFASFFRIHIGGDTCFNLWRSHHSTPRYFIEKVSIDGPQAMPTSDMISLGLPYTHNSY